MNALAHAGLIGKYVRMERPATAFERTQEQTETVGGSGIVAAIYSTPTGMTIVWDYGMGFEIRSGDVGWQFAICDPGMDGGRWPRFVDGQEVQR